MSEELLSRNIIVPANLSVIEFTEESGPGGSLQSWNGIVSNPSYEVLNEIRSPDEGGSRKIWKTFEHYKSSSQPSSGMNSAMITAEPIYSNSKAAKAMVSAPYSLYNGVFGAPGRLNDGLVPIYVPNASATGFVPAPAGLSSLNGAALRAMLPLIRPELSAVNSAIELKDFVSLKGTVRNILKLPKGLLRKGRAFKKLVDILRVAADVYLQKKFNIDPLISDVHGIYRAVANTERRLNDLISRAGKLQVSHYMLKLDAAGNSEEQAGPYAAGQFRHEGAETSVDSYAQATHTRIVVNDASTFHAQLQYNYHYTDYQLEHARVLALLDAFGINLNPAILWNAIPWSFVVDWLVDVGRWLSTQRIGNMDPKINIMQYLWSVRRTRRIYVSSKVTSRVYYPGTGISDMHPPTSITHPVVTETAYRRQAGLPTASSFLTSGLNSTEFTLGAALVISRRKRRPGLPFNRGGSVYK
jgi:hypothetical protein